MDIIEHLRTISRHYCVDETNCVHDLLPLITVDDAGIDAITAEAGRFIQACIAQPTPSVLQQLLREFSLDSDEGRALMALAEALLRVPDRAVATALIGDQLQRGDWRHHDADHHNSNHHNTRDNLLFVRTSAMLLELGGHLLASGPVNGLLKRFSAPVIHRLLMIIIRRLAHQFVFATDIDAALQQARHDSRWYYSFDMLGEAAVSQPQADAFLSAYSTAIAQAAQSGSDDINLSIKLSALSPRYEFSQFDTVVPELVNKLQPLLAAAADAGIGITLDVEEADRLDLQLAVFSQLFTRWGEKMAGRLGLAVQAYSTRALAVLHFLERLAKDARQVIAVRLVKGAYWDSEIKHTQVKGLRAYPVFTEKVHTDLSYLACAHFLLSRQDYFYSQFATHNPVTIAHLLSQVTNKTRFEFQRLHGMGETLYQTLLQQHPAMRCRVYCPVGDHQQLLPYLVRRILENGANNSIVRQLAGESVDVDSLSLHPLKRYRHGDAEKPRLPLPESLFGESRKNSPTVNLACLHEREQLLQRLHSFNGRQWSMAPLLASDQGDGEKVAVYNPATGAVVGDCSFTTAAIAQRALDEADKVFADWRQVTADERAKRLEAFANQLIEHREELLALLIFEAGKTINDAVDEWREAVDFARYYAAQCRQQFGQWQTLPGPEGESNLLGWQGRGVFLCISPWNFPLAIFTGQVCAALAAGNCVLAKPAEDTSMIAVKAVGLMHRAGFDVGVVQCLPGNGADIAGALLPDARLSGVAFTGSTATARRINRQLADREGAIVPFIAETGGQNAMIVDSSALPEQVVRDVMHSAFYSAGQRCSALRVLFLQEEISEHVLELLFGAMDAVNLGDPSQLATDIGPMINTDAAACLRTHIETLRAAGKLLHAVKLPVELAADRFIAPHVFGIDNMAELKEEHFGPLLHVVIYRYSELGKVVAQINDSGFGLTVGIQSRNQSLCQQLAEQLKVGNVYINRTMTGAVVGVQPFGGMGLSGTGPKAGGPHYLQRFAVEKTISNNVAAIGGNINLLVH